MMLPGRAVCFRRKPLLHVAAPLTSDGSVVVNHGAPLPATSYASSGLAPPATSKSGACRLVHDSCPASKHHKEQQPTEDGITIAYPQQRYSVSVPYSFIMYN